MEELTLKKPRRIRGRGGGLDCGDPSRHRCQPFPLSPSPYPAAHPTPESRRRGRLLLFLIVLVSAAAALAYLSFPSALTPPRPAVRADADCCRGTQGLELWGPAVKWGSNHRLPSAPPARRCAPTPRTAPAAVTHGSSAGTNADARTGSGRSVHLSQFPFFIYPSVKCQEVPRFIRLPSCASQDYRSSITYTIS